MTSDNAKTPRGSVTKRSRIKVWLRAVSYASNFSPD